MAATVSRAGPRDASAGSPSLRRVVFLGLAPLSVAAAAVATVDGWDGSLGGRLAWACLTLVWAAAGTVLLLRPGSERLGMVSVWFSLITGVVALAAALLRDRPGDEAAALAVAVAIALLPAAAMHVLLAVPDGAVTGERALAVVAGYLAASAIGVVLWTERPSLPAWPIVIEASIAAGVGIHGVISCYRLARRVERRQLRWAGLSIAAALEVVLVGLSLQVLVDWPPRMLQIAAAAAIPIPLCLLLARSARFQGFADRLVVQTISLAGLTALVAAAYLLVVGWLGHAPTETQQTLVLLSIVAAAISAVLYVPASKRLASFATQLVHGSRQSPDEVVRSFSAHLSRGVPLEDLLLSLAESLRSALALETAEIWTGSGGMLDLVASDPERESAWLRLTASDESVVARAGVSGPGWASVWLPELLDGRGDAVVRVAPVSHAGQLYGLVVAERAAESPPFDEDVEDVLSELARQLGLALRTLRLDSRLQASLDELLVQADELRASRARVVAAADAERRRIERNLHDGAQQYLAGVAVNLRAAIELVDSDPQQAKLILAELRGSATEAQEAVRDLAHGIYPPLLQDRGLAEALVDAARRAPVATRVEAPALRRFDPEVEAAIYFCCLEALQNAGKHAGAHARATVRVWEEAGGLFFEIADDGVGFAPTRGRSGAGVTNMRDRLGAIRGNLRIESSPGAGTRVIGAVPLGS